jgi:hypothetical protein
MKNSNDKDLAGRLVYLTRHLEKWYRDLNPAFNVPIINRLAKIVKVFDWDTEEGKFLLAEREKTGKWKNIDSKLFKFVLKVYYPELILKKSNKVMIEEVVPRYYPGTEGEMFSLLPEWMLKDLIKEEKNSFTLVQK